MLDKVFTNNQVSIAGEVVSEFTFSHEVYGEHFYIVNIAVCRLSNSYDVIPVMVSERLIDVTSDYRGCVLQVSGQFRSYNRHEENRNRLVLSVFAREAVLASQEDEDEHRHNARKAGQQLVLPAHEGVRAVADELADLLNPRVAQILPLYPHRKVGRKGHRDDHGKKRDQVHRGHCETPPSGDFY